MKFVKDINGQEVPISNEENTLYEAIINTRFKAKDSLEPRQEQLAENMVKRGVLRKGKLDGQTVYAPVKGRK